MTMAAAQRSMARAFQTAGLESAALEARMLLGHVTALSAAVLIANGERLLKTEEAASLTALVQRRLTREPMARLVGGREFYGRFFHLNPSCLIPRPDTETVIEAVLSRADRTRPLALIDFGVGPGTILLTLLAELPLAHGLGLDLSLEALMAARMNAEVLGLSHRASFVQGAWDGAIDGRFDIVVSNPPYIPATDMAGLEPEVRHFDPVLALDGGADGLAPYRILVPALERLLAPQGLAAFEFGLGQGRALCALARQNAFVPTLLEDLSGLDRVLLLQKM